MTSVTLCPNLLWDFSGVSWDSSELSVTVKVNNFVFLTFWTFYVDKAPVPLLLSVDIDLKGEVTLSPHPGTVV